MTKDNRISALIISGVALVAAACGGDGGSTLAGSPALQAGATATGGSTSTSAAGASGGTMGMSTGGRAGAAGQAGQTPSMMNPVTSAGMSGSAPPMAGTPAMNPMDMMPDPMTGGGILPKVNSTDEDGPFTAMSGASGAFYVWRPAELGKDGLKHPVFVWGTGAGAMPDRYNEYFPRFATHGFIVVSPNKTDKSGSDMKAAVDWIIGQSEDMGSPFYQKVDTMRIGMGGHSQGSVATFDAEGMEARLKTTIHIAGGSFDMMGSSKVKTPTAYICGETDFALPNCQGDWETVGDQLTFFAVLTGVDHVACARNAMPGMIAWLRWHLAGETERKAEFTGPGGKFHMGIWTSQTKNF